MTLAELLERHLTNGGTVPGYDPDAHVATAAAYLDEHGPTGWDQRVNPRTLDLLSPHGCVIGQVYRTAALVNDRCAFTVGLKALGLYCITEEEFQEKAGFPGSVFASNLLYKEAWQKLLVTRRQARERAISNRFKLACDTAAVSFQKLAPHLVEHERELVDA